jgi:hypothetical protein
MFNMYSLKARVYPVVIIFIPIVVIGLIYSIEFGSVIHSLTSFGVVGALSYLLSQLGRDAGKRKEKELWEGWGGAPSTQILRWSDSRLDKHTKDRYHNKLRTLCATGIITDQVHEQTYPAAADEMYQFWINYLKTQTRDKAKFALLFSDNISYGFRRNLWGMKTFAICFLILLMLGNFSYWAYTLKSVHLNVMPIVLYYSEGALFTFLIVWMLMINRSWVRIPADSYAERLVEATEQL